MNQKKVIILILGVLCFCLPILLSSICNAQAVSLSIVDFNSQLKSQTTVGGSQKRTYQFVLILRNNGSTASEDMQAQFSDPELGGNLSFFTAHDGNFSNFSINPGETKMIYSREWPTMMQGAISINVSYGPISPQSKLTPFNSGYRIYTIQGDTTTKKSTPGFELAFLFIALILFIVKRKIKT